MDILVVSGSPKGENSITLHTCLFLEKKWKTSWMMYLVGWLMRSPTMKRKAGFKMAEGMIGPYKKILE